MAEGRLQRKAGVLMRGLSLAALLIVGDLAACAEELYREVAWGEFLSRTVLVSEDELAKDRLLSTASLFVAEMNGKRSFSQLLLARTPAEVVAATAQGMTDIDEKWWRKQYNQDREELFPVARITVSRNQCVIEMRDKAGNIERSLLGATDPLVVSTKPRHELLHVMATVPDEPIRHLYDDPVHVSAYVRSAASGSDIGPSLWIALSALFGTKALVVTSRSDHWFIGNSDFPFVYPFMRAEPPPASSWFDDHLTSICDADRKGIHCALDSHGSIQYVDYDFLGNRQTDAPSKKN